MKLVFIEYQTKPPKYSAKKSPKHIQGFTIESVTMHEIDKNSSRYIENFETVDDAIKFAFDNNYRISDISRKGAELK